MPSIPAKLHALAAVAALALVAAPVAAGPEEWDQAKVTALAREFMLHVSKIKTGVAKDWDREDKQSARYVVLDDVMSLHHRAVALHGLLRHGKGAEATAPVFRRVLTATQHARRDAARFPQIEKQRKHIEAADAALAKLEAYYGPEVAALPPRRAGTPPPPLEAPTPLPPVAAAAPDKTFRRKTTEPAPVAGCPVSVTHHVSMHRGGNVRIWVHPSVTDRNEVTTTAGVIMAERGGRSRRGELIERRLSHVPDLPANCRIRRLLTESLASCEFDDDDEGDDSQRCDIIRPNGLVRSVRVGAQSPGLDFDCDDRSSNAYAELSFNPIEVEVVCD